MKFPNNNLPTESRYWAREVEKNIVNLTSSFRSAEINNTTRDSQLSVTANNALRAATDAQTAAAQAQAAANAASDAVDAAAAAQAAADDAQNQAISANSNAIAALQGLGDLDQATSTYKINASNVTVGALNADLITTGSLSADRISGGTIDASDIGAVSINGATIVGGQITGANIRTNTSGQRVELSGTSISFFNGAGASSGTIYGDSYAGATLRIDNPSVLINASQTYLLGQVNVYEGFSSSTDLNVTSSARFRTAQFASGGTTGASIDNEGKLQRTSSSLRYKTDVQPLDIDVNELYQVEPKSFKRIEEVESNPEDAITYAGFIAEELAGTSLDKFVFYSTDDEGNRRPEGVHYPELTAALLIAIKDLNTRLEILESR